jgi:hypothetical protein
MVERPRVGDRCFISHFPAKGLCWVSITWYWVGPLGGCSPCLCCLRIDGLAPVSKYWMYRSQTRDMGPVSLVACHQQRVALPLLLQCLSWERNWVWTHRSVSRRAVDYVGSPFSREQWLCPSMLMTSWKVAMCWPHEIRIVWKHTRTEHGMRVACWSGFPCRCTSLWIATTLGYD